jgi:SAM-dependent methyltransferase
MRYLKLLRQQIRSGDNMVPEAFVSPEPPACCPCCGGSQFVQNSIMWQELAQEWKICPFEYGYIDRQQGLTCTACGSNLRSAALAAALTRHYRFAGTLKEFTANAAFRHIKILEINEAGGCGQFLYEHPGHTRLEYPQSRMESLSIPDSSMDIVLHSDTLEHVTDPVLGLRECRRVLIDGGACLFTVPILVDRPSRSRAGMPPSYHGREGENRGDYLVHTEFGHDVWKYVIAAGFREYRLFSYEYPASLAHIAVR